MSTPSKAVAWSMNLPDEDSKIGRALAGGHLPFLAKAVVGHECLYELVFLHILDRIDAECNTLCQRNAVPPSVFWKIPVSQLGVYSTGKVAWTNYSQRLHHCCRSSQRSQATVTIATRT